jgi:hypothetical protein
MTLQQYKTSSTGLKQLTDGETFWTGSVSEGGSLRSSEKKHLNGKLN